MQFDEKWNFIAKKEKNCDPDDAHDDDRGDDWDHTAVDPEHRLLLAVIPGERSAENYQKVVQEVYERTDGKGALLLTSDADAPYATAIEEGVRGSDSAGAPVAHLPRETLLARLGHYRISHPPFRRAHFHGVPSIPPRLRLPSFHRCSSG